MPVEIACSFQHSMPYCVNSQQTKINYKPHKGSEGTPTMVYLRPHTKGGLLWSYRGEPAPPLELSLFAYLY